MKRRQFIALVGGAATERLALAPFDGAVCRARRKPHSPKRRLDHTQKERLDLSNPNQRRL